MGRGTVGPAMVAFVIVGFVLWVAKMPKSTDGPPQAVPQPAVNATAATTEDDPATAERRHLPPRRRQVRVER